MPDDVVGRMSPATSWIALLGSTRRLSAACGVVALLGLALTRDAAQGRLAMLALVALSFATLLSWAHLLLDGNRDRPAPKPVNRSTSRQWSITASGVRWYRQLPCKLGL